MTRSQAEIDRRNEAFWDELCGSHLAQAVGLRDASAESLARFDKAYMDMYPYLYRYIPIGDLRGRAVLEIGLGYGTLGQMLAAAAGEYHGIDIASGPVAMMQHRLRQLGDAGRGCAVRGSALDLPYRSSSFDYVYTIGCLHHTGNIQRGVEEVRRVLVTGGTAVVMLYHRHSFRRVVHAPFKYLLGLSSASGGRRSVREFFRARYDTNLQGEAAPHIDVVSRREIRRLFREFTSVKTESQNSDRYALLGGRLIVPREKLLGNLGRVMGLDLYVVATK